MKSIIYKDNIIGRSLKTARQAAGFSQTKLAKAIGTSHSAISFWENGVNIPNVRDCWSIADALNITIDELIGRSYE